VVHFTSAHQALDTRIFVKECRTLAAAGYDVVLICPDAADSSREGVRFAAVSRGKTRLTRMTLTVWRVLVQALRQNADVYHFHDPELIPAGLVLRLVGKRVVYDVHEDLPRQVESKPWIPGRLKPLVARGAAVLEAVAERAFAGIVAATPTIGQRFCPAKTIVVKNFPLLSEFDAASTAYDDRPMQVAYVGSISFVRGATHAVRAVEALPEDLGAQLVLAGKLDEASYMHELQALSGWSRVRFAGWQDRDGVRRILDQARVGLVTLHPVANYIEAYPVKLFEYMLAGLPVVASRFPLWEQIVKEAGCGLLVDPLDPEEIAAAIAFLLRNPEEARRMGERGREAVLAQYRWDHEAAKLVDLYRALAPIAPAPVAPAAHSGVTAPRSAETRPEPVSESLV
jgi:glycosyltransferase involved in cell wall biosynthesis